MAEHHDILWAIMEDPDLTAPAKCVATVLLLKYRNHNNKVCNPSFGKLAQQVGRTRRPVIAAIYELRERGYLDWTGTKGGSPANTNQFWFRAPQPVLTTAPVSTSAPVLNTASTGAEYGTQPVLSTAHEPSIKPSKNQRGSARARATSLPDDFELSGENLSWAVDRLGSSDAVERSMARFKDHYRQVAGNSGLSRDWQAKARLWIGKDAGAGQETLSAVAARLAKSGIAFGERPRGAQYEPSDKEWSDVVSVFVTSGRWTKYVRQFGPAPREPGCRVPERILIKHGIIKGAAA